MPIPDVIRRPGGLRPRPARLHSLTLPRELHPAAWWGWAIGMAAAASMTTNPLLLVLDLAVVSVVVVARRGDSPWSRAYRLYLYLGAAIIAIRMVLHVLVGVKVGTVAVLALPTVTLPAWAAGIDLLGTVHLEGLLAAAIGGLRLAVIIACVGAANALANPKRLLKTLPSALHEIGAALVVAVSVAPQLAESVHRVLRARRLRGDPARGVRAVGRVALPVLQDTLDRSLLLAAAMESRGYGRRTAQADGPRAATAGLTLGGLIGTAVGTYGLLDATAPGWMGPPLLVLGLGLALTGLHLSGRSVRRTVYRPDPWATPEWMTVLCGAVVAATFLVTARTSPGALTMPLDPLAAPQLPVAGTTALLLGTLPGGLTPPPPLSRDRVAGRRSRTEVAVG